MTNPNPKRAELMAMVDELDALRAEFNALADDSPPSASSCHVDEATIPGPRVALYPYPNPVHAALIDELATLRADNDARGVLIEQLRSDWTATATELDTVRSERDAAWVELDTMRRAVELANARADRQAARAELAEAETARQQRLVALFVRVLREMTPEAE